ncbi:SLAM family member 5-like [Salvelinus fontinalis]|uniref:SLAM family member 5-like n=1 Tax=Salvelinus fontinalis TaxID=8038 RepID=UPI002486373B|nr:SLAM family member 5-like [Salvelinus fontinalis]
MDTRENERINDKGTEKDGQMLHTVQSSRHLVAFLADYIADACQLTTSRVTAIWFRDCTVDDVARNYCKSCSVVCFVDNRREVTLSWYRGEERLTKASFPDLSSANLSLPLEIKLQDKDIYSCVAANPVSNQTTKLNVEEHCPQYVGLKAEVKPPRGREGQTVTLHTGLAKLQSDAKIFWIFGPVSREIFIVESQVFRGEVITEYKGRFQGRLQLDRQTGSLTIRNLTLDDSGVYQLQVVSEQVTYHNFSVTVYASVPTPNIRNTPHNPSVDSRLVSGSCSVVCSVANGKEVTLSWYRGEEKLNNTSSPHQADLSLPLEIKGKNSDTYSCVATNPVSNQTTKLRIEEHCRQHADSSDCARCITLTELAVRSVLSALVAVATMALLVHHFWHRRNPWTQT